MSRSGAFSRLSNSKLDVKDTHRKKGPSNETPVLTKSINMEI